MIVRFELERLGIPFKKIEIGYIETDQLVSPEDLENIRQCLSKSGLVLMNNKKRILIERIKNVVIDMVHYSDGRLRINFSQYLSSKLNFSYTYLSNIFSEIEKITIEHFIIQHKIQRVKELIRYNELSLKEISWKLHYSSVAHLSCQFKKITGVTPSHFKMLEHNYSEMQNM